MPPDQTHEDEMYTKVKEGVLKGRKSLPFKDYVELRTIYFIEKFATDDQLEKIQKAIDSRYLAG